MPGNAPVEAVGGTQSDGPWPDHVDEIVEGESYERPVQVLTEIRCTSDGQTFGSLQAARDHVDANHGGDYSLIETEEGVEKRTATVTAIQQFTDEQGDDDGYAVTIQYDRQPGGT